MGILMAKRTDHTRTRASSDDKPVQIGVRIPRSLHFALKAAALKQERDGKEPSTQADIIAEAIRQWIKSNDYEL
jgi:hypothetical protein